MFFFIFSSYSGPSGPLFYFTDVSNDRNYRVTVITIFWLNPCSNVRMNIRHLMIGSAALAMTVSTGVFADGIYKWTDAQMATCTTRTARPVNRPRSVCSSRTTAPTATAVHQRVQAQRDASATRQARPKKTRQRSNALLRKIVLLRKKNRPSARPIVPN